MASPFGLELDTRYMQAALAQASKAFSLDEVPVGVVVVNKEGAIVARAHNKVESFHTQTAHAELLAITKVGKKLQDWRLEGHWVYVTLEPCSMCMQALILARVQGIVYGASSPLFGYHLDKNITVQLYKSDILTVVEGICKAEAAHLLKTFFQKKRIKGG